MIAEFLKYLAYSVCLSWYLFMRFRIRIDFFLHSLQLFTIYVVVLLIVRATFPLSVFFIVVDVLRKFFYSPKEVQRI